MDWTNPQSPPTPSMPQTSFFSGRWGGKSLWMRQYLYSIWQRYKAGEDVGRPYVVGPGWRPLGGAAIPCAPSAWVYDEWRNPNSGGANPLHH